MTVDKELLLKPRLTEADVEIPGLGTVRVRALNRGEVMKIGRMVKSEADAIKRAAQLEAKMLAAALVDPEMTEAEVTQWQKASPAGELDAVANRVQELSGMIPGAAKEAYMEFEQDPDAEFHLPPG